MGTHIVLFLKQPVNLNFNKLMNDLYNSYKQLGQGILVENTLNNPNLPIFVFDKNKEVLIEGNNHHITINILGQSEQIKDDIIEMIWDAFDLNDLEFIKLGYIKEVIVTNINIEEIKKRFFKEKAILDSKEFELAYHTTIKNNKESLNCWKRYMKYRNEKMLVIFDINNRNDQNINYKYLKNYLEFSDNYIEKYLEELN